MDVGRIEMSAWQGFGHERDPERVPAALLGAWPGRTNPQAGKTVGGGRRHRVGVWVRARGSRQQPAPIAGAGRLP